MGVDMNPWVGEKMGVGRGSWEGERGRGACIRQDRQSLDQDQVYSFPDAHVQTNAHTHTHTYTHTQTYTHTYTETHTNIKKARASFTSQIMCLHNDTRSLYCRLVA